MSAAVDPTESAALQRIEAAALKLSTEVRATLAERLWASLEGGGELGPAWGAEVARRMQEVDDGVVHCRRWDEVMAELRVKHQG